MALRNRLADVGSRFRGFNKYLRYGNDTPGNGDSGQPYIQKDIPGVDEKPGDSSPDFLLRKPQSNRLDDLTRIGRFLASPSGLLFTSKQKLLDFTNPVVLGQPNRQNPNNVLNLIGDTLVGAASFNANILAQVGGAGLGYRVASHGKLPGVGIDPRRTYLEITKEQRNTVFPKNSKDKSAIESIASGISSFTNPVNQNRLTALYNTKVTGNSYTGLNNKFAIDRFNDGNLLNYLGGPNATNLTQQGGPGKTIIPLSNPTIKDGEFQFSQKQIDDQFVIGKDGSTGFKNTQDFRKEIIDNSSFNSPVRKQLYSFDYSNKKVNRTTRIGTGDPTSRKDKSDQGLRDSFSINTLKNEDKVAIDKINYQSLYSAANGSSPYANEGNKLDASARDLITFYFSVVDNEDPQQADFVHFRAFLGSLQDNYNPDYSPVQYIGRGERFYNYNGFTRNIDLSWNIYPQTAVEMKAIHNKLNFLSSCTTPDYKNGYMKANIVKLWVGEYMYGIPGIIRSLSYNNPEESNWEINFNQPEGGVGGGGGEMLTGPMLWQVSMTFTPLHDFVPRRVSIDNQKAAAFITPTLRSGGKNPYLSYTPTTTVDTGN